MHLKEILWLLVVMAVGFIVVSCGMSFDALLLLEKDCAPKMAELQELPGEGFSFVSFCKCTVLDKKPVPLCKEEAEHRLPPSYL